MTGWLITFLAALFLMLISSLLLMTAAKKVKPRCGNPEDCECRKGCKYDKDTQ